jgi:NDP-sugar pyrophosphorylase family protein
MQIIVPMAGSGARFRRAGYQTLKPLIEVDGLPMIEHVVRMFPGEHDFLFICAEDHLQQTPLRAILKRLAPGATIVAIEPHKAGPVYSALAAGNFIKDDQPVILNYCDVAVLWDYAHFRRHMVALDCDGCLIAFKGFHPHSLGSTLYAYIREQNHRLLEIREKQAFTDQRMNEYASTGTYYFRSGALLKHYFTANIMPACPTTCWSKTAWRFVSTPSIISCIGASRLIWKNISFGRITSLITSIGNRLRWRQPGST